MSIIKKIKINPLLISHDFDVIEHNVSRISFFSLKIILVSFLCCVAVGCTWAPITFDAKKDAKKNASLNQIKKKHQLSQNFETGSRTQISELSNSSESKLKSNVTVLSEKNEKMQKKLDALSRDIKILTLENQRISQKNEYIAQKNKRIRIQDQNFKLSGDYLLLRQKVNIAQESIKQNLSQLTSRQSSKKPKPDPSAKLLVPGTYTGNAVQNDAAPAFDVEYKGLYHTVYVTGLKTEWSALWYRLEQAAITDKWKGFSVSKGVYFIYVGAYAKVAYAEQRQQNLLQRIGLAPEIITGADKEARTEKMAALLGYLKG